MTIKNIVAIVIVFFAILVLLVVIFGSWGTIETGHRGISIKMGAIQDKVIGEGFYTKTPWIESVIEMNVQTQKEQVKTGGASKDLQEVHAEVAANLHIIPSQVGDLYQKVGVGYMDILVAPAMQESIKAVVSQFTAEELITKRELVREGIRKLLKEKMISHGIEIEDVNVVNFGFSASFNAAIEAKVTAEQNAFAAKNKLAQIEFEAQQKVAEAKGKAEAMTMEAKAMASSPQILELRALEKWDGHLPQYMGSGSVPFIDITQGKK